MTNLFVRNAATEDGNASLFTDEKIASARSKIIEWLNETPMTGSQPTKKCEVIKKIQEIILHSDSELIEEFLTDVLAFSHDTTQEVRRAVVAFIEEACKLHIDVMPRVIDTLAGLLRDSSPQVIKRVIQGCAAVYKNTLQWLVTLADVSENTEKAWNTLCIMKAEIVDMIDHDNDGIRTNAIKFLEGIVILQTYPDEDSMKRDNDFSLEDVPMTLKIVRRRKLEDEAIKIFDGLLKFHAASHISSVNLITCTGTLCTIAKMRPSLLSPVIDALKNLQSNLPPTLTDSQVSSVQKHMKMQLINILKQPAAFEMQSTITKMLSELGASNQEIARALPKMDRQEHQRRLKRAMENASAAAALAKRQKLERDAKAAAAAAAISVPAKRQLEVDYDEVEEQIRRSNKLNEEFIIDALKSTEMCVELLMVAMQKLPNSIPAYFLKNYTPIVNTTVAQTVQRIAIGLSTVMTEKRIGPGASAITKDPPMRVKVSAEEEKNIILGMRKDTSANSTTPTIAAAAGGGGGGAMSKENDNELDTEMDENEQMEDEDEPMDELPANNLIAENTGGVVAATLTTGVDSIEMDVSEKTNTTIENLDEARKEEATKKLRENMERTKEAAAAGGLPKMKQKQKLLKLSEVTKPLSRATKEKFLIDSVNRVLRAEKKSIAGGVSLKRRKILTVLAATFTGSVRDSICSFIMDDIKNRLDLAFSWLYEEYSLLQGFTRHSYIKSEQKPDYAYNKLLSGLIKCTIDSSDKELDKEMILKKFYLEAPIISDEAFELLNVMCCLTELSESTLHLIKELVIHRPPKKLEFLKLLFTYSVHENVEIRDKAIENLIILYEEHKILTTEIDNYALRWLTFLENASPPLELFSIDYGRNEHVTVWNELLTKICLSLFLAVMPYQGDFLLKLCAIYSTTTPEMKRTILRAIETAIKKMGPENLEIYRLIEQCPKGSEALINRIIYVLTEKGNPNVQLADKVRELYQTKWQDARLLIPIINGLTKKEVLTAMPKLLKLNEPVVKELFNRLLGIGKHGENKTLPLSASELLVALHTLDTTKIELKYVVKATSLCLSEREYYTQDVLAIVLQQLVEITPLPTLLMRTVIQSLTLYPRLTGYVTNLLQRLIPKQVWKQKVVWDGFLKCCQRLKPHSFPVMMTLPPPQLQEALNKCPELRQPMIDHANQIIETQGSGSVSKITMDILLGNSQDLFITEVSGLPDYGAIIPVHNIKVEIVDDPPMAEPILNSEHQPLPPGEDL